MSCQLQEVQGESKVIEVIEHDEPATVVSPQEANLVSVERWAGPWA